MIPEGLARTLMLVTLVICVLVMPLAYVAKHRWNNRRLTQGLSTVGIVSMLIFIALVYNYLPD
jgi:hypothetical protein